MTSTESPGVSDVVSGGTFADDLTTAGLYSVPVTLAILLFFPEIAIWPL